MNLKTKLLSSLDTVYNDYVRDSNSFENVEMLQNEAASVQLAAMYEKQEKKEREKITALVSISSPIADKITIYTAENVPLERVCVDAADDWFIRKTPGLYPDRLHLYEDGLRLPNGLWKALWININEELSDISGGEYPVAIKLTDSENGDKLYETEFTVKVMGVKLPKQKIYVTNWIHYDCIAYLANTEPMTETFFETAEKYIRLAVKNGQNMILTPAFTPPLDTPVGEERNTVQLVAVEKCGDKYHFDLSLLDRFIKMCLNCGAEYFEHSHLFTQWGAEHAPKIVVKENGEDKKMFGWHTDATSAEYREFLHAYLTELKKYLTDCGFGKRFFFHVSDEPYDKKLENYKSAADFIHSELEGYKSGDALREYDFYENGLVKTPIVANSEIDAFYQKANPLWMYYTGGECYDNLANRVIGMPHERSRILGVQLYYHNIEGFLHWGYNAHHSLLSRKILDPRLSADMGCDYTGGSSFLVYPDRNGAEPSPRLITFRDLMQDTRAFFLLEELTSREHVCEIIKKHIPDISFKCFVTAKQLIELRAEVNGKIEQYAV